MVNSSVWAVTALALVILALAGTASAGNITDEVDDTWIRWEWNLSVWNITSNNTANVIVDNEMVISDTSVANYYTITGLNPREEHVIRVTYSANNTTIESLTSRTAYPSIIIYFLITMVFIICFFMLFIRNPETLVLFGTINVILSMYIATAGWRYIGSLSLIGYLTAIYSGIIVVLVLWTIMSEKMRWG